MQAEPSGVLVRAVLDDGAVRLILAEARAPSEHTRVVHGLGRDAARLGAEATVAAALNAAHVKGEEKLTLQLQGEDPRCSVYADVTAAGELRARVTPADLRVGSPARLRGVLVASKSVGPRQLYRGATEIADQTVEQALGVHLDTSMQVQDILRIGVTQEDDGEISQAGGLLLERLPSERGLPSLSALEFAERYDWVRHADIDQLLTQLAFGSLGDRPLTVLESKPIVWRCRCSRERVRAALTALGPETLEEMAEEDGGAEVTCDFCNTAHHIGASELRTLR